MDVFAYILAILGSAGFASVITHFFTKKKTDAETIAMQAKAILDMDQRLTEKIASLEQKVAFLEGENEKWRKLAKEFEKKSDVFKRTNATLIEENMILSEQIEDLVLENEALRKENKELKVKIEQMEA